MRLSSKKILSAVALAVLMGGGGSALGRASQKAEPRDALGGLTFCQFREEHAVRAFDGMGRPEVERELFEADFSRRYVQGLRTGELRRPSIPALAVPMARPDGEVVVYSPGQGQVALRGDVNSSDRAMALEARTQRGVRLDVTGAGRVVLDESLADSGLEELYIFTSGEETSIQVLGMVPCLLIDGGREQAAGPLTVDGSQARLPAGDGDTAALCGAAIYGTSGRDAITGTGCSEEIFGLAGNDFIDGNLGADKLFGNEGSDCLTPGDESSGVDKLYGGMDNDFVFGTAGTEECYGDNGYDYCSTACEKKFLCDQIVASLSCVR